MAEDSPTKVKSEAESTEQGAEDAAAADDAAQKLRRGHTVSRPPSSHITRVDEESSASDSGGRSGGSRLLRPGSVGLSARSVETVDRGVGPTPHPVGPSLDFHHAPTFPLPPFLDPRNGLLEPPYGLGYPYAAHYPPYVNPPLPLSSSTLEGRYHWPPPTFHQPLPPGLAPSPVQSDISLLSMRSPGLTPGESVTQLASRIQWEQLQQAYYHSPGPGRRFSPASLPGFPGSLPGELPPSLGQRRSGTASGYVSGSDVGRGYISGSEIRGYLSGSDVPPTPGSGSITLPGSLEGSRLTSPRPSIYGKSRKRALSHSPISDYLDIQSLTRSSEGSLQLTSFLQHNSRSSSAASGSYGHLSAASLGTSSPHPPLPPNPYFRHGPMPLPGPPFFYPPMLPPPMMGRPPPGTILPPGHLGMHTQPPPTKFDPQISTTMKDGSSSAVSSTMDSGENKKSKIKKEAESLEAEHEEDEEGGEGYPPGHVPQEGEPDFIETNCHWVDCEREFDTQDDLVKHINQDHIQANKKSFICRWKECSREEKPFKAQYMLVVHMRRHTGEKPHRCTFEGCNKAYSRLENLKTHLRSHTGEKPYLCEFPGCTKAFSNASDRAKHQNRTHSNAKPYACKAAGCTKRYTDPSSLRKHVKTVHGPEFYANKKHKGDGCKKEDPEHDQDTRDSDSHRKADDPLMAAPVQGGAGTERRRSQDTMGPSPQSQSSPQNSPEVNVTCGLQPDLIDEHIGGSAVLSNSVEEEVDIPEPDEADVPSGSNALLTRRHQMNAGQVLQNRMKGRLNAKASPPSVLPQIPSIHSPGCNRPSSQTAFVELSGKTAQNKGGSPMHKRITDLSARDQTNLMLPNSRRNSNTSTLSSYMSSMRSDTSPFPQVGSKMSSRRSSESSQVSNNRLSINNSPYEYDITGNRPQNSSTNSTSCSRRSSESSNCNVGTMSAMMQKANLGSHPNLVMQSQGLTVQSPSSKYSNERLARYFAAKKDYDARNTNTTSSNNSSSNNDQRTSTPSRTPLPDEIPGREVRRASDPCRAQDPNFESLRRLQRFHSLNMMKPLPVPPNMKSLQNKGSSNHNFHSSRSSIATDYSLPENGEEQGSPGYSFPGDLDPDAALDERMLEDNMDMIIPDDMQRFLMERYNNNSSQPTPDHMQRFYMERCNSVLSASTENQQQRQQSQMSFGDSTGVDSGCGSQMSQNDSSSVVSNFMQDQQQLSPPMSGHSSIHGYQGQGQGQGHFSPNLHVQTGFDSAMSSPMPPAINSPYGSQAMTPSPMSMPQSWPQGQGQMQGQGHPSQGDGSNFMPQQQQQQQMPQPQPRHHQQQQQQQMQGSMGMRGMMMMSQGGHCPNNMMNGNNMSMMNCTNMGLNGNMNSGLMNSGMMNNSAGMMGNSSGMMSGGGMQNSQGNMNMPMGGMQNSGNMGTWQGPMPNPNSQNAYLQQQQAMMQGGELPGAVYSPMPPPMGRMGALGGGDGNANGIPMPNPHLASQGGNVMGMDGVMVKPNRSSPQVQVPHISQSQIPPNAKAASRGMMMRQQQQMMNQQMQQQQQQMPMTPVNQPMPPPQPPSHPHPQMQQQNMYMNNGYPYNNNYQMYPNGGSQTPNMMDNAVNTMNPQGFRHSHRGMMAPPSGATTPTGMFRHPHPPTSQRPSCQGAPRRSPHPSPHPQQPYPYPMEMSPGCNQVTSSTDRKETTAPPIEDFMDNITSLSTENLIENISADNVFGSTSALSNRSASQNSNRFNPVLNTSNMVVNDMSSMLTQLAEENKYLSMRP